MNTTNNKNIIIKIKIYESKWNYLNCCFSGVNETRLFYCYYWLLLYYRQILLCSSFFKFSVLYYFDIVKWVLLHILLQLHINTSYKQKKEKEREIPYFLLFFRFFCTLLDIKISHFTTHTQTCIHTYVLYRAYSEVYSLEHLIY